MTGRQVSGERLVRRRTVSIALHVLALAPGIARSQGGPPFLTNDPGTPGNANWEINLGSMQSIARPGASYEVPQIDVNFGVGDRIQLAYMIPYVLQTRGGETRESGWGNGYTGVKWRFLDQGPEGWQMSIFPQLETAGSALARREGLAVPGPRDLLPLEMTRKLGPLDIDFEAGYYIAGKATGERTLGLVAGRPVTKRLELDAEIYDDRGYGTSHSTTLDFGGRFWLRRGIIALFMAGCSLNGPGDAPAQFVGYIGVQFLLSDYGRTFTQEP
jgi:hypothetical protein